MGIFSGLSAFPWLQGAKNSFMLFLPHDKWRRCNPGVAGLNMGHSCEGSLPWRGGPQSMRPNIGHVLMPALMQSQTTLEAEPGRWGQSQGSLPCKARLKLAVIFSLKFLGCKCIHTYLGVSPNDPNGTYIWIDLSRLVQLEMPLVQSSVPLINIDRKRQVNPWQDDRQTANYWMSIPNPALFTGALIPETESSQKWTTTLTW